MLSSSTKTEEATVAFPPRGMECPVAGSIRHAARIGCPPPREGQALEDGVWGARLQNLILKIQK